MVAALVALLHVLVFAYWLGGDLGAFYASWTISDPKKPAAARIAAAQALSNLDMAPRTALILAFPTGFTLALQTGWIQAPAWAAAVAWAAALCWLWMAWRIHLRHLAPTNPFRRLDLIIRWIAMAALGGAGFASLADLTAWPAFIGLKMLALAATIALGLWVRRLVAPFSAAFGKLASSGPTPEVNAEISRSLARVRPAVLGIWALLAGAALLGLWRPA